LKEQKSDPSFSLFLKERSLFAKERKSDHSFHCSFQKSKRVIALFVALYKRVNKQSLLSALFAKGQKSDRSLSRSFEKSNFANVHTIALFERLRKRAIGLSLFQKEQKSENEQKTKQFFKSHIIPSKRRAIVHKVFSLVNTSYFFWRIFF